MEEIPSKTLLLLVTGFEALAIPGGFVEANFYDDAFCQTCAEVIQHFDHANKPIASICVAKLGPFGILTDRPATTSSVLAIPDKVN